MFANIVAAFRQGLKETGYVEGQNVAIEYRWARGQYDRLPSLAADLVRRQVAVIVATAAHRAALAAKAATTTIPIVFVRRRRPGRSSASSPASTGRAATSPGFSWFSFDLAAKRLELLHELVPEWRDDCRARQSEPIPIVDLAMRDVQAAARSHRADRCTF